MLYMETTQPAPRLRAGERGGEMMTYFNMSQLSRGASAIGRMVQEHEERVAAFEHDLIAALARVKAAEAERDAALARYEAAEAEVAQWRGFVTAIQERLQVALARVAELEAQLAAQGMRDDDDNPNS